MQTDKSGPGGPRSTRDPQPELRGSSGGQSGGGGRYRQPDRRDDREIMGNNMGVAPQVPSFAFPFQQFSGPNGMSMLPPGFMMPGQNPAQPPPPGA